MDLYKPLVRGEKSEKHVVFTGRMSAFIILALATLLAIWFTRQRLGVFDLIQNVGAWVAAPIAAIFLLVCSGAGPPPSRRRLSSFSHFPTRCWSSMSCSNGCRG